VILPVGGGGEAFYAHPSRSDETIPVGARVLVVEYLPPRTVHVTRVD
jgi:hypothetical protein